MDHSEVLAQKLAEKYVLGELSPELREQFEEHYFDCAECAADLEALATLMRAGKAVSEEDTNPAEVGRPERMVAKPGWFTWLRPIVAVPVIVSLAAVIVLQNAGFIPRMGKFAASRVAEVYITSYRLQGQTRGVDSKIVVNTHEAFGLDFDFTPTESFPSYKGTLLGPAGDPVLRFVISGAEANKELHLLVPRGTVGAGNYSLVFTGENAGSSKEVQRLRFAVEVGS